MHRYTCFLICSLVMLAANAKEPRDPRTRDEDISGTTVSVNVFHAARDDGLYEYVYTVHSSVNNKGSVLSLDIDLSCALENILELPEAETTQGSLGHYSVNGPYVPAIISADYGQAFLPSIGGVTRKASWGLSLDPGESSTGLRLLSAAAPAFRKYELVPFMDNDRSWAYPERPQPDIPWISDFTVTGAIAAPGCPNESVPLDEPRFAGAHRRAEADPINALLSYRAPLTNRFHVEAGTKNIILDIVYSKHIDPATFAVEPDALRALFNPVPGGQESVVIPLTAVRTVFHLGVGATDAYRERHAEGTYYLDADRDSFEIRHAPTQGFR